MQAGRANAVVDDLVSLAMEEGLERCLLEIARSHENKTGQWLDAHRVRCGFEPEGLAGGKRRRCADAPPVETATQQMETFFKAFRDSLEKE